MPEEGATLAALAKSFAFALEDVPTQHFEECFRRAIQTNTSDFPLTAAAVYRAYQGLIPELEDRARRNAEVQTTLLRAGYGSLESMGVVEWKVRHNLPEEWHLGDNYPPESDLYDGPYPEREQGQRRPPEGSSWKGISSPWKYG